MKTKKNVLLISFVTLAVVFIGLSIIQKLTKSEKLYSVNRLPTKTANDEHDIYRDINTAWDRIEMGDQYAKSGNFEKAAKEYKYAYSMKVASRSVSGFLLAETYEKLAKYEEGIHFIDQMISDGILNDNGFRKINEIRARLLTAKAQAAQSTQV